MLRNALKRDIEPILQQAATEYPIVTLMGPRQSGKTTIVQSLFPHKPYYNLERPDLRQVIMEDPVGILNRHPEGAIFDEVQRYPELLSYLQVIADEKKKNGLYILTGSHQSELHAAVSQSLAGRTAIFHLLPLSLKELMQNATVDQHLYTGFMPKIHHEAINPTHYYRNYLETYIEKDIRQLIHLKDLFTFQRFIKLCAGRIGQIFHSSHLANELGVSHHTIQHWLSIMQATFVIQLLPPYFENFGKRIIKSPKLYFFDVGLVSYLLDIESFHQIEREPLKGYLFENMVIMELYKTRLNQGHRPNLYYFRDSQQHEIDVIFKKGSQFIAAEIKSSQTMTKDFFKQLHYFNNLTQGKCEKGYVIYSGNDMALSNQFEFVHYQQAHTIL